MFDRMEMPGAAVATSLSTAVELARLLAKDPPEFGDGSDGRITNIMFAFFFGESYDYLGSSR